MKTNEIEIMWYFIGLFRIKMYTCRNIEESISGVLLL